VIVSGSHLAQHCCLMGSCNIEDSPVDCDSVLLQSSNWLLFFETEDMKSAVASLLRPTYCNCPLLCNKQQVSSAMRSNKHEHAGAAMHYLQQFDMMHLLLQSLAAHNQARAAIMPCSSAHQHQACCHCKLLLLIFLAAGLS